MTGVKTFALALLRRLPCSRLSVSFLDASIAGKATTPSFSIDLLAAQPEGGPPPEWVRFLGPGMNRCRDGRAFNVDVEQVVQLSTQFLAGIEGLIDFEHQFDRSAANGQPAPAAAWIKELSAKGPDGTPGVWARVDWLPDTVELIKQRKYRYLSAAIAHDAQNNVSFVPRASLTNLPATHTATALFSADHKETPVNFLTKLLAAFGLAATKTEDEAIAHATALQTLAAALAKQLGIEIAALSAMTADKVAEALSKPLATKLATLAATAKVTADAAPEAIVAGIQSLGVDPDKYVPRAVHDEVANRLATLTAETTAASIDKAKKEGKLTPAQEAWAKTLTPTQLSAYLATAPVIVTPGDGNKGAIPDSVATLSAEDKAEARRHGVSDEAYLKAKQDEDAEAKRRDDLARR